MGAALTSTPHSRIVAAGASDNPLILRERRNEFLMGKTDERMARWV